MKHDLADFKPMEAGGFLIGDDGFLGGFEALRLVSFVFRGVDERWSGGRVRAFMCEGNLSPRWGWVLMAGRNPALTRWAIV